MGDTILFILHNHGLHLLGQCTVNNVYYFQFVSYYSLKTHVEFSLQIT